MDHRGRAGILIVITASLALASGCALGCFDPAGNPDDSCGSWCPAVQTLCGGLCVTLESDTENCGTCGFACAALQACESGRCVTR